MISTTTGVFNKDENLQRKVYREIQVHHRILMVQQYLAMISYKSEEDDHPFRLELPWVNPDKQLHLRSKRGVTFKKTDQDKNPIFIPTMVISVTRMIQAMAS